MKPLPLDKLGARENAGAIDFGVLLPGITPARGDQLFVKVIHEHDQFLQDIQPNEIQMNHYHDAEYGDYWFAQVRPDPSSAPSSRSSWGQPGRYVYRFRFYNPSVGNIDWVIDPFAREFGVGKLSAITLGYLRREWDAAIENTWKTPAVEDLIMYELNISEFGGDIDRTIQLLNYLQDLGVNCLELMPVSNVSNTVDWGYMPIGYFGVDERFGNRKDFQRLVEEAHKRGIAIILDAVYAHCGSAFAYEHLYNKLKERGMERENPMVGSFAEDAFGGSTNFQKWLTQDFFLSVNHHWLDCYHVDGFRYDYVPGYWDGPVGQGYANLVYHTYQLVKSKGGSDHWQRFFNNGSINLVQCAEQLNCPREILKETYSNCTWQDETFSCAKQFACGSKYELTNLGFRFTLDNFPDSVTVNDDSIRKSALQYIENHDHSRFVCNFGRCGEGNELLQQGDRERFWYRVQPYLIGIMTAKGIPLLWQGQEFGENYVVPDGGMGRVMMFRPVRWDYFYDNIGKATVSLLRKLIRLRRERPQFRHGAPYFYNDSFRYQNGGILLSSRSYNNDFSLVALNFSSDDRRVQFQFPHNGNYREELHGTEDGTLNLYQITNTSETMLRLPSNYGRIWTWAGS